MQSIDSWHIDKRVPLALIGAILAQTGAVSWWASSISERVSMLEQWRNDTKYLAAEVAVVRNQSVDLKNMLTRIEQQLSKK